MRGKGLASGTDMGMKEELKACSSFLPCPYSEEGYILLNGCILALVLRTVIWEGLSGGICYLDSGA